MSTHPYHSPEPDLNTGDSGGRAPISTAAASVISVVTWLLHLAFAWVALRLGKIFEEFGAELPALTQLFLPGSWIYYVFPILCVIAYVGRWLNVGPSRLLFLICFIGSTMLVPVFIIAMYLPIIKMGDVVG